ncbi:Uncharacterised protein [Streptococcus dysgalactiae subsp. equisimilis]|uniref:Uncharacterized protein n=1 Tax=Streptococcus dysgalactiae subsp. equisimilis TaxID=119602 RepID=A0AAE9QYW1_STREQ|nr:Uncharacterised protein [Streptococcus dysgalactiae subsp. equisimilis]
MELKRKRLLPYLLLSLLLAYLTHRAYVLYCMAPQADMTNLFAPYTYVFEKITEPPYFYWNTSPLAILSALVGFFVGLLFYLKIRLDGNYRHGERIRVCLLLRRLKNSKDFKMKNQEII